MVRNYNVAAGAHKQERDERTYIKGAYGRFSRDDDNRAEVQFLRPDGKHYSAILACFRNDRGDVFTVAQVLYLASDGAPRRSTASRTEEMSIAEHCANLAGTERVRQQLEKRGFAPRPVTTSISVGSSGSPACSPRRWTCSTRPSPSRTFRA